jgi:hypothetical protein
LKYLSYPYNNFLWRVQFWHPVLAY